MDGESITPICAARITPSLCDALTPSGEMAASRIGASNGYGTTTVLSLNTVSNKYVQPFSNASSGVCDLSHCFVHIACCESMRRRVLTCS